MDCYIKTLLLSFSLLWLMGCSESSENEGPEPYTATGEASYYGRAFHGQKTASGDTYRMDSLTAAHLYLPLGTLINVENLENNRTVEVIINDRGPYSGDRILDLSKAAADSLGMIEDGMTRVKITVMEAAEGYTIADSVAEDRRDDLKKATQNQ